MKKTIVILNLITLIGLGCKAQKNETRNISTFKKIEISGAVNVIFTQSDTTNLVVNAASDEINRVSTEVVGETLTISNKGRFYSSVNIYLKNKYLNELITIGATNFKTQNTLQLDTLTMDIAGASMVNINVDAKKIDLTQTGASEVILKGQVVKLQSQVSGASALKAYGLMTQNANIETNGASIAKVNISNKIKANASGASTIKIKGDVKEIFAEATSAATIKRIENQDQTKNENDTTKFNWGHKKVIIIGKDKDEETTEVIKNNSNTNFKHWRGIYLGVNGYMNSTGGANLSKAASYMNLKYPQSYNTQINLFERQFNLSKNYFKIVSGLGFDFHRYELAKKTILQSNSIFTSGTVDTTNSYSYKSNRLNATYLQIPLLLEINTSKRADKTFHLAFGVVGGFLLSSRTYQKLEQSGYNIIKRKYDDYNISPFSAKAHVNFGYANWTFYGEYNLTPLFERNKGPELYPFNIGLRIIPFS